MRKTAAVVASIVMALSLGACGGSNSNKSADASKEEAQEQTEEKPSQVFESDQVRVEYRETIDSTGNALVLFALTNNTDRPLMVASENVVANGEYSVTTMGGSDTSGIQPGTTGQVSIVFGVSTQTPLEGVGDLTSISGDLVLRDSDHLTEEVGMVHVDVTI